MEIYIQHGLFTVLGALITGSATYFSAKKAGEFMKMKGDIEKLANQVEAYYKMEEKYKEKICELEGNKRAIVTIQVEMRRAVEEDIGIYPEMTARDAKRLSERWK